MQLYMRILKLLKKIRILSKLNMNVIRISQILKPLPAQKPTLQYERKSPVTYNNSSPGYQEISTYIFTTT
jgi:hypothetical protein